MTQLDWDIATKVMGWRWLTDEAEARKLGFYCPCWVDSENQIRHSPIRTPDRWLPSSHLPHAWEVAEKLNDLGYGVEILSNPGHGRVRINYGESASVVGAASEIPLLICKAALAALRATEGKGLG